MKIKFNQEKKVWEELPENSPEGIYIDGKLKQKLDNIRMIQKKDWDCIFMIDGFEGSGKTTLGLLCAWYLSDCKFTQNNICKSTLDATNKLGLYPDESVLIIDEGDLMLSSKDVWNKEQQRLIKLTKVIRFKRMVLIIIMPCFFDIIKGIAVRRTRFLLHVYTDEKLNRGRVAYFGERKKKILYELGKKNFNSYAKPSADFVSRFTDYNPLGDLYHEVKGMIVQELLNEAKPKKQPTEADYLTIFIQRFKENCPEITNKTIAKGFGISTRAIYRHLKKNKDVIADGTPPI